MYGYRTIHSFDPNAQDDLGFNCQSLNSQPHYISIFQIHHIDYLGPDFTKLKHNNALTPII